MFMPSGVVAAAAGGGGTVAAYTMTAGISGSARGYTSGLYGSVNPNPALVGVNTVFAQSTGNVLDTLLYLMEGVGVPNTDQTFIELSTEGIYNTGQQTIILQRSAALYEPDVNGRTRWEWALVDQYSFNQTYNVLVPIAS